jgi:HEAT repeat protein
MTFATGASGTSDTSTIVWDLKKFVVRPQPAIVWNDFDKVWTRLGANSLKDSLDATSQFIAGGDEFLDLLEKRVGTMLDAKTPGSIDESIKLLDHPEWAIREEATLHLMTMRGKADVELRLAYDEAESPEIKCRLSRVLKKKFSQPKSNVVDLRRWSRIVFALEQINTRRTQTLLKNLAAGSTDIDVSIDAQDAFQRNERRNALRPF